MSMFTPPPPQVYTVIAYTCERCEGTGFFSDESERTCACFTCSSGLMAVMLPLSAVQGLPAGLSDQDLYAATVALAKSTRTNLLPALLYNTAGLSVGQLPYRPRIPLTQQQNATKTFPDKSA